MPLSAQPSATLVRMSDQEYPSPWKSCGHALLILLVVAIALYLGVLLLFRNVGS